MDPQRLLGLFDSPARLFHLRGDGPIQKLWLEAWVAREGLSRLAELRILCLSDDADVALARHYRSYCEYNLPDGRGYYPHFYDARARFDAHPRVLACLQDLKSNPQLPWLKRYQPYLTTCGTTLRPG